MGFSTDAMGSTAETLYVTGTGTVGGGDSPGLGKIDLATKKLVPIKQFSGDALLVGQSAELTGTGDARLFGFFTTSRSGSPSSTRPPARSSPTCP